jgi:hypothetical protein
MRSPFFNKRRNAIGSVITETPGEPQGADAIRGRRRRESDVDPTIPLNRLARFERLVSLPVYQPIVETVHELMNHPLLERVPEARTYNEGEGLAGKTVIQMLKRKAQLTDEVLNLLLVSPPIPNFWFLGVIDLSYEVGKVS